MPAAIQNSPMRIRFLTIASTTEYVGCFIACRNAEHMGVMEKNGAYSASILIVSTSRGFRSAMSPVYVKGIMNTAGMISTSITNPTMTPIPSFTENT